LLFRLSLCRFSLALFSSNRRSRVVLLLMYRSDPSWALPGCRSVLWWFILALGSFPVLSFVLPSKDSPAAATARDRFFSFRFILHLRSSRKATPGTDRPLTCFGDSLRRRLVASPNRWPCELSAGHGLLMIGAPLLAVVRLHVSCSSFNVRTRRPTVPLFLISAWC
jgi:hypothetical protein